MSGSYSIPYLSFSSASASHLSDEANQFLKTNLSQKISQVVGLEFIDPEDFSLEGRTLAVLQKSDGTIKIELTESQAKRIEKILAHSIGFIRNTGNFEYGSSQRKEVVFSLLPVPDTFREAAKKFILGPCDKGLGLCKDALAAVSFRASAGVIGNSLGGAIGAIDLVSGMVEIEEAKEEMAEAERIADKEGYARAEAELVQSQLGVAAGGVFIAQSLWSFAAPGMSGVATAACLPLFALFMTIGSVIGTSLSIFGIQRCNTFLNQLNEYLENPHLSEEQRIAGALRFLQEMISLSPEEEARLELEIPDLTKREEVGREILENKVCHAKRRTSLKCLIAIANTSEELLRQIADPAEMEGGIKQAFDLIKETKKASYCKIALNALAITAILVTFAALVAGIILSGGALPLILALGAGAVCLTLALYSWVSREFFPLPEQRVNPELL